MGSDDQQAIIIVVSVLIYFLILGIPIMKILNKAGYSRAWILILIVPLVNLVMLWVFAFARWPALSGSQGYGLPPQGYPPHPQQGYAPQGFAPQYPPQGQVGGHYPPQQPPYPPQQGR